MRGSINTYKYGREYQESILALLAREPSFVRQYIDILKPEHFDYPLMITLSRLILENKGVLYCA
jgi:hypothetical protein